MTMTITTTDPASTTATVRAEALLVALAAHPGATAFELAADAGMGRSTVSKALAALEAAGRVRRTPGGREGGRRIADRWAVAQPTGDDSTSDDSTSDSTSTDVAQAAPLLREAASPPGGQRLGRGRLAEAVLDYLQANPGDHGPVGVAKAIGGKSSGAVGNALGRLAEQGRAVLVGDSPRRYRASTGR